MDLEMYFSLAVGLSACCWDFAGGPVVKIHASIAR